MRTATLAVALAVLPLLVPEPASACSKGPFGAPLGDRMVYLTGTATEDTLLAGPGSVRYGAGGGHFAAGRQRLIYGQVVAVDALGGRAAEGLPPGVEEVVIVPWDYDPSCRPLPWGQSARWVPPGTAAFYVAELRAVEQWVDGRPTLDLHNPGYLPYTGTARVRGTPAEAPVDSMLTPAQLFDLYRALPSADEIEEDGTAALGAMREWIERNPELLSRAPVDRLVHGVVYTADRRELSRMDHPVHGTWRFAIRLPDGSTRIVYGRTDPRSTDRWSASREPFRWSPEQLLPPAPQGLGLMVFVADALESLPTTHEPRDIANGWASTTFPPNLAAAEDSRWAGRFDYSFLSAALGDHPVVHRIFLEETERNRALYLAGSPFPMPATFTRGSGGVLRVRQEYPLPGGEEVVLEGEQLSRQVVRAPD